MNTSAGDSGAQVTRGVIGSTEFNRRHAAVRAAMESQGFDALIAYSNAKVKACVRYLSNYFVRFVGAQSQPDGSYAMFGSCAVLFPIDDEPILVTDQPWDESRAKLVSVFGNAHYSSNFGSEFGRIIADRGYRKVGIDNWFIFPAMHFGPLKELAPDSNFMPTQLIERAYRVKSDVELQNIRRAAAVAVISVESGLAAVGIREREYDFALAAEIAMRTHGDLELASSSIISGGPNTSTGSSLPTQLESYVMQRGDWALFDICPSYNGYAGDISRMIVAGDLKDLDPDLRRLYDTTLSMNEAVIAAVRPGVTPRRLNEQAQSIADKAGFGPNKIGLLGHSMGLDMHDPPDYYYDDSPLDVDMCISVEPCLLVPGVAGARIEDVVCVTEDGCEVLTAASPKKLRATGR